MSDYCENCLRHGVDLDEFESDDLSKKGQLKYNNMQYVRGRNRYLCTLCDLYILTETTTTSQKAKFYWPAMICEYLFPRGEKDPDLKEESMAERWSIVPSQWRQWWLTEAQRVDPQLSLVYPEPKFVLATRAYNELMTAIDDLRWVKLSRAIDKHLSHPSVRCPFGCSEFLHKTNRVGFEHLLTLRSNGRLNTYSDLRKPSWIVGMKPNFPSKKAILDDSEFWCSPCVIVDPTEGLQILTCRYHSAGSHYAYLHVPESPTGTLCTPNSNQFAPAKLRTRTIRPARLNNFSDTYELAMLQGGFDGIDSTYVTTKSRYDVHDALANRRDCLSIAGRDDMYYHVLQLGSNKFEKNYLPQRNVDEKLEAANNMYGNVDAQCKEQLESATFIPLSQAIDIQEGIYNDTAKAVTVYQFPRVAGDTGEEKLYTPKWPSKIVGVHPNDNYGNRFDSVRVKVDSLPVWIVVGAVSCVPELWTRMCNKVTDNITPFGYIMGLAWATIKKTGAYIPKKDPFCPNKYADKDKNRDVLRDLLGISGETAMNYRQYLNFLFHDDIAIKIIDSYLEENNIPTTETIMIVTDSQRVMGTPPSSIGPWELRFVVYEKESSDESCWDGSIFARHGNDISAWWWKQSTKISSFWKATTYARPENCRVAICIYVRNNPESYIELRKRYFATMNGQSCMYCRDHKLPLITNYAPKVKSDGDEEAASLHCCYDGSEAENNDTWAEKSVECNNRNVNWVCPKSGCGVAVCGHHLSKVMKREEKQIYLISRETCLTCEPEDLAYTFVHDTDPGIAPREDEEEDNDSLSRTEDNCLVLADVDSEIEEHDHGPIEGYDTSESLYAQHRAEDSDNDSNGNDMFDTDGYYCDTPFHQTIDGKDGDNEFVFEGPEEISSVPFHVLSNQNGHLLMRQSAKLRMNKKHENVQQKLYATSAGNTLPLVYAEALLFPDIFFKSESNGTIIGALPTGLWADASVLNKYGVASMRTHAQTRIFDPALLCSTDSRYHFMMFDCLANLGLRGHDSRVVLHRGFAERQGQNEGIAYKNSDGNNEIYGETVDDQANVHKLCALTGQSMPHFFITQSCNQKSLRGLRMFRKWLQDETAIQNVMAKHNVDHESAKKMLRLSACVTIERTWNVVSDLWMKYIFQSPEQPLGPIEWAWWRKEFQDETGNVSHIHGIAKSQLDTSQKHNRDILLNKIRGSLADLVHYEEAIKYQQQGFISSLDCLKDILQDAAKYLPHTCHARCQVPKLQANGETSYYCKVPNNYLRSPTPQMHTMLEVNVDYTPRAMEIMVELGMATYSNDSLTTIEVTNEKLKMITHLPKTSNAFEKFSPTNGMLFILYPSSQNLQFCTGMSINSYLTKYAAGIDKVSILNYRAPTRGSNGKVTKVRYESLNNTKITSVKIHNKKRRRLDNEKRKSQEQTARLFTHPEAMSVIAGETLVTSTMQFKHMQTSPREFRAATNKKQNQNYRDRPADMITIARPLNIVIREDLAFPLCRRFSHYQKMVVDDEIKAPLKLDGVTIFSMRPPELRFVNMLSLYTAWFEREAGCSVYDAQKSSELIEACLDKKKISKSKWIDGFNGIIKIRRAALKPCLEWAQETEEKYYGDGDGARLLKRQMIRYLKKMIAYSNLFVDGAFDGLRTRVRMEEEWKMMTSYHLTHLSQKELPIVWITPVYPRRKQAFLIQILLSFGRFETEYELMLSTTMKRAFENAGLLDTDQPYNSFVDLMNKYVDRHLRTFPGSRYQFSRCMIEAHGHIRHLFLEEDNTENDTPAVLQTCMTAFMDDKIREHMNDTKGNIIERTHEDLVKCGFGAILPTVEQLHYARSEPIKEDDLKFFPPDRHHCGDQGTSSYEEQQKVILLAKSCVEDYADPTRHHKNLIICGGPGVGKTTVCQLTCVYILSRGLNMITTSLVARRSKELGGIHYHRLLSCMDSTSSFSPGRQAEKTLAKLYRSPHVVELLRSLDSLFVDELGLFSAEQMAVLDIILRYIKRSSFYMGGIFVFGTIDVMQLMTFKGTPFLMSGFILTDYRFIELKHSVRAAKDLALQEICNMTRLRQWTQRNRNRFRHLLKRHCNFLDNFQDPALPEDAIFVFGKKAPCSEAENIMLERMKHIYPNQYVFSKAVDQESTTAGNWRTASVPTKRIISKRVKRKESLMFYPRARYEFTYNDQKGKFMQGQLAYLPNVPQADDLLNCNPIRLLASPPGCKDYPPPGTQPETFQELGWYEVTLPFTTTQAQQISNGIQGRRSQYGIRPRVASTIHAAMGSTLSTVVTALVPINGSSSDFGLWDPAQVVVLLSRTQYAKNIYFVGNKKDTINSLLKTLQEANANLEYINVLLQNLCLESVATPIYRIPSKYCSQDAIVPNTPGVYLLASTKLPECLYIGETTNIRERLSTHNQGRGPACTRHTYLRPWGMVAFVTGFHDARERRRFEARWKVKYRMLQTTRQGTFDQVLHVAREMCTENNSRESNPLLRLIQTGRINNA